MRDFAIFVVIFSFLLISLSINDSFADQIQTKVKAFDHANLKKQPPTNAQSTLHDDTFEWKKGQEFINYTIKPKWNFKNNNLMDANFTRTWNHTMHDHENQTFNGKLHNWWTGLTLYRVGEVDTVSGTYEMDFFYWIQIFEDNDPADFKTIEPDVDFVNAVEYEVGTAKGIIQKPHYYEADISGVFYTDMDFEKFPFEKMNLNVIVEPWINDTSYRSQSDSIQFHAWPYQALAPNTPSPGFEIVGYNVTVADKQYSEGDTFSRYEATFELKREFPGSFLKFIAPVFLMSGLAMASLIFPSGEFMTKIELNAIFLLGILFFVQVVSEEIPSTGSMTVFDHLVMLSYAIIVVTIAAPAIKWSQQKKYDKKQEKLDVDEIDDRRDTDLAYYELNDLNSQLILLTVQLQQASDADKEDLKKQISAIQEKRTSKRTEINEKKVAKFDYDSWKEEYDKNQTFKASLGKFNKKINRLAWLAIGSIAIVYGSHIGNVLLS